MPESYKNKVLFDNLINRLRLDQETGKYSLPGIITEGERTALIAAQSLLSSIGSEVVNSDPNNPFEAISSVEVSEPDGKNNLSNDSVDKERSSPTIIEEVISSEGLEDLLDTSAIYPKEFDDNINLGLDFGTAYSKACIVQTLDDEEKILDLPLGIYAGEDSLEMPVHSSLFIDPDGRLYFGPIAVEKSLEARINGYELSRIDSIKSFLIEENRVTIDDSPLSNIYNPTDVHVSKAALLAFYLGYLLHLVRETASNNHGIDITKVRRRVSLPCYEPHHREKVVKEISKLFTLGDVLGKSFRDEWENGFRIQDVMYLYGWMRENINKNSPHVESFLEEPLAVAGSRLGMNDKSIGNAFMVVDVGAGTTDFGMFEIMANAQTGYVDAREIKGSGYGVPVAGDKLDTILLAYILDDSSISRTSPAYKEALISLRLDIRNYKERLFKHKKLTYSLPGGITGQLTLGTFLEDKSVKEFSTELRNALVHVLSSIHPSWINTKIELKNKSGKLPIILTGGGASLPMLKALLKGSIDVGGHHVLLHLSPTVPKWISDEYEGEIIDLYSQMAVSIGGGKRFVMNGSVIKDEYS